MPSIHLIIKGKVQGVFYRASTKEAADKLGLTGWVKNTIDGNVEAFATGTTEQLNQFTEWCRNGPRKAVVTEILITEKPEEIFNDFSVRREG